MYYSSFGILALLVLIIINYNVLIHPSQDATLPAHRAYRTFLFSVIAFYISDILWGIFYILEDKTFVYADTVVYFVTMALAMFFWTRYAIAYINEKNKFASIMLHSGNVFLFFMAASLAINFFIPVTFYFDQNGVYHSDKARYLTLLIQILLYSSTAIYMLVITTRKDKKSKLRHRTIGVFGLTMTILVIIQIIFPLLPFYAIGYMIGTCLIHTFVLEDEKEDRRKELEKRLQIEEIQELELGSARLMAFTDPLTGVKSKAAYNEDVLGIEKRIEDGILKNFGLIVFDVNDLKLVNDTKGHKAGDAYIIEACSIISHAFSHSPIYRIGGDEFVVFLYKESYKNHQANLAEFKNTIEENKKSGGVIVSYGFADFKEISEKTYKCLFETADARMYERKRKLKNLV